MSKLSTPLVITAFLTFLFLLLSSTFYVLSQRNSSEVSNNSFSKSSFKVSISSNSLTFSNNYTSQSSAKSSAFLQSTILQQGKSTMNNISSQSQNVNSTARSQNSSLKEVQYSTQASSKNSQINQSMNFTKTNDAKTLTATEVTKSLQVNGQDEDGKYVYLTEIDGEQISGSFWVENRPEFTKFKFYKVTAKTKYNPKVLNLFIAPIKANNELYAIEKN